MLGLILKRLVLLCGLGLLRALPDWTVASSLLEELRPCSAQGAAVRVCVWFH